MSTIILGYMENPNTYTESIQNPTTRRKNNKAIRISIIRKKLIQLAGAAFMGIMGYAIIAMQVSWGDKPDGTASLFVWFIAFAIVLDTIGIGRRDK